MTKGYEPLLTDGVLVDGAWRVTDARFDDVNPATEETFATAPDGSMSDMDAAIDAARQSADDRRWSGRSEADRAKGLEQLADALNRHAEEFAALGAVEWGVTANERADHIDVASHFASDTAANLSAALEEESLAKPDWGLGGHMMRAPVGVVGAITPWNFPHTINMQKLAPALAAGNSIVLKPSPLSPLVGLGLAKLVHEETDIPPGVVNVVTTASQAAAELLTSDPRVDMVTFVGSAATARAVGAASAATMKRTLFELGGKSAAIYLDDFDVSSISTQTVMESCAKHAGQACVLFSRLVVHESIYADFVSRLGELAAAVKVGDPADPSSEMGPLIDDRSRDRIEGFVTRAVSDGARLVTGGGRPAHLPKGFYFEPTVLADVDNSWEVAQQEIFGPVTCVIPFRSEDEAVRIANDSAYGLVGSVYSSDLDRAVGIARQIDAGVVTVNGAPPFGPFGGFKQSGIGREGGILGIRSYTELRSICHFG